MHCFYSLEQIYALGQLKEILIFSVLQFFELGWLGGDKKRSNFLFIGISSKKRQELGPVLNFNLTQNVNLLKPQGTRTLY